ncbi:hypothetical protein ACIPRU_15660 [Streptomyces sp. NPDC090126]|uniref:hypothetical protein n=1 Tax=Streptomyces sp. NPDC090126 TaxID=3365952 RepID=UPI0038290E07
MSAASVDPQRVERVAKALAGAMSAGNREPYSLAFALEAAGLLQSPESAAELDRLRARVAELEALKPARFQTCRACGAGYEHGFPCSTCEFKRRMAAEVASVEDPHDSPLHHTYALGRDLPEVTPEPPAVTAERWNAQHPVGTPVYAYPEDDPKCTRLVTRTRSKASVLGGHTAVVWVEGHSACISLTHVDPRPETGGAS